MSEWLLRAEGISKHCGGIVAELAHAEANEEAILSYAVGERAVIDSTTATVSC